MSTLADRIERYLKDLIAESDEGCLELKRNELAQAFTCVPSQINYVLETRFTNERGYHVVSRRGAGGYFKIIRLEVTDDGEMLELIRRTSQNGMSQQRAEALLSRLLAEDFITKREHMLLHTLVNKDALSDAGPDLLRAHMMRNILVTLLRVDC